VLHGVSWLVSYLVRLHS